MSIPFYSQFNILPYFDKKDRLKTNEVGPEIAGTCPLTKKMHSPHNMYIRVMQLVQW